MKKHLKRYLLGIIAGSACAFTGFAQLDIPSDGTDGEFKPQSNVEIDLGLAANGNWSTASTGTGVYDSEQWAVVFKYQSVKIPAGVKVTFKNHPTSAPVVWLVRGNVEIDGELSVAGADGSTNAVERLLPPEGGPGGFRGGALGPLGYGAAHGPGAHTAGHGYGVPVHGRYASRYGNPQIVPLIGGSGAAITFGDIPGGGGGGAILIAASGAITVNGRINANGGANARTSPNPPSGSHQFTGSGGAIRLIGDSVKGSGVLTALGVTGNEPSGNGNGRIRIETPQISPTLKTFPETVGVPPANPPLLWPAPNVPSARVVSVDAVQAPVDPRAPLVASADVAIQNNNEVIILIETKNFPVEGAVELFITPKFADRIALKATYLGGDIQTATWQLKTKLPQGFVTLQARATQP